MKYTNSQKLYGQKCERTAHFAHVFSQTS